MGSSNFDIFDVTSDDIKDSNHAVSDTNLYKISPENGRNGTYNSIIRFVPFWKEPKKSLLNKWTYFLEDPVSGKKRKSNEAIYTFVAVDQNGGPIQVPELTPESEEEKDRYEGALRRKQLSLILAGKMNPADATELKALFL